MTKTELKNIFLDFGITLPSSGTTEMIDLPQVQYMVISKLELKFHNSGYKYKFDMTNEQLECYKFYPNGKIMTYPGTETPVMDVYDFSTIVIISGRGN